MRRDRDWVERPDRHHHEKDELTAEVPPSQGKNVKEADKQIIADLKAQGSILKHAQIRHEYPFCYRSGTPLIDRAKNVRGFRRA